MDIGVGKGTHKGERSGVLLEEPRAIINPFKEEVYQNGRRIKEPGEPMFTITVTDRHGIVHQGRNSCQLSAGDCRASQLSSSVR